MTAYRPSPAAGPSGAGQGPAPERPAGLAGRLLWPTTLIAVVVLLVYTLASFWVVVAENFGWPAMAVTLIVVGAAVAAVVSVLGLAVRHSREERAWRGRLQQAAGAVGRRDQQIGALTRDKDELERQLADRDLRLGELEGRARSARAQTDEVIGAWAYLADRMLPALLDGQAAPRLPEGLAADPRVIALAEQVMKQVTDLLERERDRRDRVRLVALALARRLQSGALEIYKTAVQTAQRFEHDSAVLEVAYAIQHAAQMLSRQAQSTVTIAGEWPGQRWRQDVQLAEIVRAAAGRTIHYARVEVTGDQEIAVVAPMVEPVIHTVAELLSNAAQSAPATTTVQVQVRGVPRGAVISIDDEGVGLSDHELRKYQQIVSGDRVVAMEEIGLPVKLGLAVVGRYADRHRGDVMVHLERSPYGGVRAVVLIGESKVTTVQLPGNPAPLPAGAMGTATVSTVGTQRAPASGTSATAPGSSEQGSSRPPGTVGPGGLPQRRNRRSQPAAAQAAADRTSTAAAPSASRGPAETAPGSTSSWEGPSSAWLRASVGAHTTDEGGPAPHATEPTRSAASDPAPQEGTGLSSTGPDSTGPGSDERPDQQPVPAHGQAHQQGPANVTKEPEESDDE